MKPNLVSLLLFLGSVFIIRSVVFIILKNHHNPNLFSSYNLISPASPSHNHLGDFLILPLLIFSYRLYKKPSSLLPFFAIIIILPFIVFSFSRSAYLSIIITTITIFFLKRKLLNSFRSKFLTISIIVFFIFFLFATIKQTNNTSFLFPVHSFLTKELGLGDKFFFALRDVYFKQAVLGIKEKSFFGIGPGNYQFIGQKYEALFKNISARTSHNVFLEIASENGLPAAIIFLLIILLIIKGAKKDLFFFLFFAILINFQTDYTYLINCFFMLFFVLSGIIYEEKNVLYGQRFLLIYALVLYLIINLQNLSFIFSKQGNYRLALVFNPLNKGAYMSLINQEISAGRPNQALSELKKLNLLYGHNSITLRYLTLQYLKLNKKNEALKTYQRLYLLDSRDADSLCPRLFDNCPHKFILK